jgi:hypothetical protein
MAELAEIEIIPDDILLAVLVAVVPVAIPPLAVEAAPVHMVAEVPEGTTLVVVPAVSKVAVAHQVQYA